MAQSLSITGRLIHKLPEVTGQGQNGPWSKQLFVIQTSDQFPKKICFEAWNDKTELIRALKKNESIEVFFNVESREYNGKWYTTLKAWKIEAKADTNTSTHTYDPPAPQPAAPPAWSDVPADMKDDLPF
jgi:hypothetical protein